MKSGSLILTVNINIEVMYLKNYFICFVIGYIVCVNATFEIRPRHSRDHKSYEEIFCRNTLLR